MALDGETLRGSRHQGAPAAHLLSALSHRLGLTLWPQAVADKTKEIPFLEDVWHKLVLEGRVITVDAPLTPPAIAQHIVESSGDDVLVVQGHQPRLHQYLHLHWQDPCALAEPMATTETVDVRHGCIEPRWLTPSTALVGYSDGRWLARCSAWSAV